MLKELETLLDLLETKHGEIKDILEEIGNNATALNWKPGGEDNLSIFGLAVDAALQEDFWVSHVVGQLPEPPGLDQLEEARGTQIEPLLRLLDAALANTAQVFEQLTAENLDSRLDFNADVFATRWCLLNALQHAAENLGQITILWQWWQEIQESIN